MVCPGAGSLGEVPPLSEVPDALRWLLQRSWSPAGAHPVVLTPRAALVIRRRERQLRDDVNTLHVCLSPRSSVCLPTHRL